MRLGFSLLRLERILVAEQPENIVIEHLRRLRRDIGDIKSEVQTLKAEMATKSDLHSLRAAVASDLAQMQSDMARMQKDTRDRSSAFAGR